MFQTERDRETILTMPHLYCFVIFLAGIYTVYTYPFEEPTYYPDYYEAFGIQEPVQIKGKCHKEKNVINLRYNFLLVVY